MAQCHTTSTHFHLVIITSENLKRILRLGYLLHAQTCNTAHARQSEQHEMGKRNTNMERGKAEIHCFKTERRRGSVEDAIYYLPSYYDIYCLTTSQTTKLDGWTSIQTKHHGHQSDSCSLPYHTYYLFFK